MLEKIKKFILKNKKLIIISTSVLVFIIICLLLVFKFFINSSFYYSESKTANDSKEALNTLYQDYEKSRATFKVYGDVTEEDNLTVKINCNGEEKTVTLSNEPVTVNNHCTISLTPSGHSYDFLSAYVTTPDGSLITVNSFNTPELQLNAYKNETRIVLKSGILYNRINKQDKDSIFSIQVGNSIFISNGNQEMVANAEVLDFKSAFDLFNSNYTVKAHSFYEEIETDTIVGIAGFQIISGGSKVIQRGNMRVLNGEKYKHFIFFNNSLSYETIMFAEGGADEFADYYALNTLVVEEFVDDQETLDENKELDFIGIVKHDEDIDQSEIDEIMKKYHDYYNNKNNADDEEEDNNDNNTSNRTGCNLWYDMTGYRATDVCWCRNDIKMTAAIEHFNGIGYNFSSGDIILCEWSYSESDINGVLGDISTGGNQAVLLKSCALELGWPGTYSNEGGYSCYNG